MSERVSTIDCGGRLGKTPILLVAPHGYSGDDENTALLVESMANTLNCYAVINRGWERSTKVDIFKDKADCNNVTHCHEDVVKEEFLDPILRYRSRILRTNPLCHMFMIHGMSDAHRIVAPTLDMVIGYGAGNPSSKTCETWRKDCLIDILENKWGFFVYEGKKGGQMSGWARNNMNQLFRKWYTEPKVQSMQIEIIHDLRKDVGITKVTAEYLADAILDLISRTGYKSRRENKQY